MSLRVGQCRQSCLFLCYVTAEQSGGSRTTLMLTGRKEHSSLPETGCCILLVNLLAHSLTSQSSLFLARFPLCSHNEPVKKDRSWIDKDLKEFYSLTPKTFWTILDFHVAAVNHLADTAIIMLLLWDTAVSLSWRSY